MNQNKLMQPRASSAFWSVPASNGRAVSSNSVKLWWLGRGQHKEKVMFEQKKGGSLVIQTERWSERGR